MPNQHIFKSGLRGCLYEQKYPEYSTVKRVLFYFLLTWEVFSWFADMNMSRDIVLSLVLFDFRYSSAIITLNLFWLLNFKI